MELLSRDQYHLARLRTGNQMKAKSRKNIIKAETKEGEIHQIAGSSHYFYVLWSPFNYHGIDPREIVHP
jgi:hypothetical protein